MATSSGYNPLGLIEFAHRHDPNGQMAKIIEVLAKDNEILIDAPFVQANDVFSNKTVQRLTLPTGTFRGINEGVAAEASQTKEVFDTLCFLETYSETDVRLVDNAVNPRAFRSSEAAAFLEGMSQTMASAVFYGNAATDPKKFTGLAPRMNALATQVLGSGGTGSDTTSIYVVQWGEDKVHFIYPRGSQSGGVKHMDRGQQTKRYTSGSDTLMMEVYVDHFTWDLGLVVKNPRCIARIANIETSGTSNIFNEDLLIQVLNKMPQRGRGAVLYCNDTILSQIDIAVKDKANVNFTYTDAFGVPTVAFRGMCPIRKCDAILNTETAIS